MLFNGLVLQAVVIFLIHLLIWQLTLRLGSYYTNVNAFLREDYTLSSSQYSKKLLRREFITCPFTFQNNQTNSGVLMGL